MDKDGYLKALQREAQAFAEAAKVGLDAPVPTCPGWSVGFLVFHLGAVHRAQAGIVRSRSQEPVGLKRAMLEPVPGLLEWFELVQVEKTAPTPPSDGLIEWFEDGARDLVDVLRATDVNEPMWSWSETKRAAHYLRMMPIETVVHRWDAQLAHHREQPVEMEVARDGIDHTFDVMLPFRRSQSGVPAGRGETFGFRSEDTPGTWTLQFEGSDVTVEHTLAPSDVTVEGTASDLFLFLWNRVPTDALQVSGDSALLGRYFELVPPR
jgi:uncharacterized protein (TIGR03083 family)